MFLMNDTQKINSLWCKWQQESYIVLCFSGDIPAVIYDDDRLAGYILKACIQK